MCNFIFSVSKPTSYFIEILNNPNILIRNFTGSKNLPYRSMSYPEVKESRQIYFRFRPSVISSFHWPVFVFFPVFLIKVGPE